MVLVRAEHATNDVPEKIHGRCSGYLRHWTTGSRYERRYLSRASPAKRSKRLGVSFPSDLGMLRGRVTGAWHPSPRCHHEAMERVFWERQRR